MHTNPAGLQRKNDVVLPEMRHDDVASTSIRRHFGSICLLGTLVFIIVCLHTNACECIYTSRPFRKTGRGSSGKDGHTVELQWLEHLWYHENMFETGLVRANEF